MTDRVEFTVPGPPQGKGRPVFGRARGRVIVRTPEKTVAYESLVRGCYLEQCGRGMAFANDEPLFMELVAFCEIPKSARAKERQMMLDDVIRPAKRPDIDNILKVVFDALNGTAYRDDKQIVTATVIKLYGETPEVIVRIETAGGRR
jgi:Holliday junction resolvase RusA-like endonuclease